MRFPIATLIAIVPFFIQGALAEADSADATACHSNHGAWGGDCETLFSNYGSDSSNHYPDSNDRTSIVYESCACVAHLPNHNSVITGEQLVSSCQNIYQSCFGSNSQQYLSGVLTGTDANKYCLCNDGSQGSC